MSNRNDGFVAQIANKESHTRFYDTMLKNLSETQDPSTCEVTRPEPHVEDRNDVQDWHEERYWMSKNSSTTSDLTQWLIENESDRALKVSLWSYGCHYILNQRFK